MQVVLLLWLLAGAALTTSNPTPIDTTALVARPTYSGSGHPAVVSSSSGAAYPAISVSSSDVADPTRSSSSSGAAYPAIRVSSSGVADPTGSSSSSGAAYPTISVSSSGVADSTGSSSSSGAAYPASSAFSSGVADPTGRAFSSRDEAVYGVRSSGETASKDEWVPAPAEDLADSSESEEEKDEEDDDDVLPADEDIDARSIFAALVNDDDEDEDRESHREARLFALNSRDVSSRAAQASLSSASPKDGQRAVSDSSTIAKYNHFIDVFFRRVNSELRANAEPVEISLSKKGRKNEKNKNGKGKKGNKSKKEKRHPRDFNQKGFNETDDHLQEKEAHVDGEDASGSQRFKYIATDDDDGDDDDDIEADEDDTTEVSAGSSRQSKDLEFEDEAEDDQDLAQERAGRGIGMERRRTEAKKNNPNRSNPVKSGKQKKNNKNKGSGNKGKKRKNGKKKRKGGKKKAGGKKNKKKNKKKKNKKENRGRSRDSEEESDLSITQGGRRVNSGMESRKRKDEKHNSKGSGDNSEKHKKGKKKNKKNKKDKKGKKSKASNAETQASVSGISSLIRDGDVNVTQSSDTQKISSHFLLGPVSVHLARRFSDGEAKTAVSTASLRGTVVIEVNRSGRAKITKLKLSKPSNVTTEGSLRPDDSKKKANKAEKILKTSIKKVSPQISKQIESTARAVLDTTSKAVRS